jgi:hypothetical protein
MSNTASSSEDARGRRIQEDINFTPSSGRYGIAWIRMREVRILERFWCSQCLPRLWDFSPLPWLALTFFLALGLLGSREAAGQSISCKPACSFFPWIYFFPTRHVMRTPLLCYLPLCVSRPENCILLNIHDDMVLSMSLSVNQRGLCCVDHFRGLVRVVGGLLPS